ncbi:zinc ion binding [Onygenales sp. PD_40]|nr:zinc ion binding [Onygenales sp. PD_40]
MSPSTTTLSTPPLPPTMRAWTYTTPGSPLTTLTLTPSHPTPSPTTLAPSDLLIKVTHTSLNPTMRMLMRLLPSLPLLRKSPTIPEIDYSGTVIAISPRATDAVRAEFPPGTAVLGVNDPVKEVVWRGRGALAEYVVGRVGTVMRKPAGLGFEEAAGLGVVGCTALNLVRRAGVRRGEKVLVNGASSGTGVMVVQMVRGLVGEGGWVVGVCSREGLGLVRGLGADEVIDYTTTHLPTYLATHHSNPPFDKILDTIGIQDLYTHSPAYLSPGRPAGTPTFFNIGALHAVETKTDILAALWRILIRNPYLPVIFGGVPRGYECVTTEVDKEMFEEVVKMVEGGRLRVVIDSVWGMEEGLKAYERSMTMHARGKVIVKVQDL